MLYVVLYRWEQDLRKILRTVVSILPMEESLFPNQEIHRQEKFEAKQKPQHNGVKVEGTGPKR